jgi:acetyl-CoA acetyltransferase
MVAGAMHALHRQKLRYALCAVSVGCGQGMAMVIERV